MDANTAATDQGSRFAGIVGGFIIGVVVYFAMTWLLIRANRIPSGINAIVIPIAMIVGARFSSRCASTAKSWRKMLIASGVTILLLPVLSFLSWMIGIGQSAGTHGAAGEAVAGFVAFGLVSFVSLILGGIVLLIGLLVGRDQKVIYIERSPNQ